MVELLQKIAWAILFLSIFSWFGHFLYNKMFKANIELKEKTRKKQLIDVTNVVFSAIINNEVEFKKNYFRFSLFDSFYKGIITTEEIIISIHVKESLDDLFMTIETNNGLTSNMYYNKRSKDLEIENFNGTLSVEDLKQVFIAINTQINF